VKICGRRTLGVLFFFTESLEGISRRFSRSGEEGGVSSWKYIIINPEKGKVFIKGKKDFRERKKDFQEGISEKKRNILKYGAGLGLGKLSRKTFEDTEKMEKL